MSCTLFLLLFAGIPDQAQLHLQGTHFEDYHRGLATANDAKKPLLIIMNPGPQTEFVSLESVRKTKERRELRARNSYPRSQPVVSNVLNRYAVDIFYNGGYCATSSNPDFY